jgi:spore cortex formation protein SpoVR/YcgB (stage V sporulation)
VILDRDPVSVKRKLLQQFTNMGQPMIDASDDNYENRGELYLVHRHEGINLREDFARETLGAIHRLWRGRSTSRPPSTASRVLWSVRRQGSRHAGARESR